MLLKAKTQLIGCSDFVNLEVQEVSSSHVQISCLLGITIGMSVTVEFPMCFTRLSELTNGVIKIRRILFYSE